MTAETLLLLRSLTFVGLIRFMLVDRDVIHGVCRWLESLGLVNLGLVHLRPVNLRRVGIRFEVYRLVDLRIGDRKSVV